VPAPVTPPCGLCGTWECLDCGTRAGRRNRFFPGQHRCRTCRSPHGQMLPTRHRLDIHDGETATDQPRDHCRYPLSPNEPAELPEETP
jgi:hypothetical protein